MARNRELVSLLGLVWRLLEVRRMAVTRRGGEFPTIY